jgi:hypothetical protein
VSKYIRKEDRPDERLQEQMRRLSESVSKLRVEVKKWTGRMRPEEEKADNAAGIEKPS